MLVLAVYFVSDGTRVYKWLAAFLPRDKRQQLDNSTGEITSVVSRYVGGSALTAMICGVYAFTVLSILGVPNAALLAVVAAFFDLLAIIGFFIFAFPWVLVALTVSGKTAILVFVLYGAYHLTEAYFIVPKIYGNRLRLSGFTVLLCCLCAGLVGGAVAILLVLPLAACYPIAERIWLKAYLEPETVQKHERMEARANPKPHLNN
jgi:predicted PurR-regulated permease PerM